MFRFGSGFLTPLDTHKTKKKAPWTHSLLTVIVSYVCSYEGGCFYVNSVWLFLNCVENLIGYAHYNENEVKQVTQMVSFNLCY